MNAIVIERLGWTIVHSVWQLAALALMLMLLVRLLQAASPQTRYACAGLTLLLMCIALPVTFYVQADQAPQGSRQSDVPANDDSGFAWRASEPSAAVQTAVIPVDAGGHVQDGTAGMSSRWFAWRDHANSFIQPWLSALVQLWLTGVALLSLRPLIGWHAVQRWRTTGTSSATPEMLTLLHRTARRMGIGQSVRLLQSTRVPVPAVIGWLKPLILLPVGIASGLTPGQLEGILAHELAHIRRRDYLVNLLQMLAEALLFYHPAVWWVSHQMRQEREDCCDDLALNVCPNRSQFASALLILAERGGALPAAGMAASGGSLLARIRRIVHGGQVNEPRAGGMAPAVSLLALVATLLLACYPATTSTLAQEAEPKSDRPSEPKALASVPAILEQESKAQPETLRDAPRSEPVESKTGTALVATTATETSETPLVRTGTANPWFWPDPYPHLGHDESLGNGWHYLRLAADDGVGQELQTSLQQRKAFMEIYRLFEERQRELGQRLAAEGIDVAERLKRRKELWLKARDAARTLLTDTQHQRIEQLMIQRVSYNAFRSAELIATLELTDAQRHKILAAIDAHLQRISAEDAELAGSTRQAEHSRGGKLLAEQLRLQRAARSHRGRLSHRRVWDEIAGVLTPQQRDQFNRIRGPMPASVAKVLPQFEPNPPQQ